MNNIEVDIEPGKVKKVLTSIAPPPEIGNPSIASTSLDFVNTGQSSTERVLILNGQDFGAKGEASVNFEVGGSTFTATPLPTSTATALRVVVPATVAIGQANISVTRTIKDNQGVVFARKTSNVLSRLRLRRVCLHRPSRDQ